MEIKEEFRKLLNVESGTILADWYEDGVRVLIMRGPGSLCAYIGVPSGHPLAGFDYDDIPLDCHGGLTFSRSEDQKLKDGTNNLWPSGYWWYGWDYAHAGDFSFTDLRPEIMAIKMKYESFGQDKQWTVDEVKNDIRDVVYDFKKLINLAEKINNKII